MGFFSPSNEATTKFSYNVIMAALLIGSAILLQALGWWLPFAFAIVVVSFLFWQLYLRHLLAGPDDVSLEDKNKIAFHTMLTGEMARIKDFQERQAPIMQVQSQRIEESEKTVRRLTDLVENLVKERLNTRP